jgi:LPXTG-motif cell wall-anchored protein
VAAIKPVVGVMIATLSGAALAGDPPTVLGSRLGDALLGQVLPVVGSNLGLAVVGAACLALAIYIVRRKQKD